MKGGGNTSNKSRTKHTGHTYGKRHRCIVCGRLHTWAKKRPCYFCRKEGENNFKIHDETNP